MLHKPTPSIAPSPSRATLARISASSTQLCRGWISRVLTDGRFSGLVTDRDITVRVLAENRDPRTTRVGDICSGELVVLDPDEDLAEASRLVRDRAVRRIPVLRDGTPVGVVSIGDLALESDATSVRSGMHSAPPNS